MGEKERLQGELLVDLHLFSLPVVQVACYTLLPQMELDLASIEWHLEGHLEGNQIRIRCWPLEGVDLTVAQMIAKIRQELTAAACQRQAHIDAADLRLLFAAAAFAPDIPEEALLERLQETIVELPATTPEAVATGREMLTFDGIDAAERRYVVAPTCSAAVLFRALSRLHDTCQAAVISAEASGLTFTVSLRDGVTWQWWEEQFASLLVRCAKGGLPAIYPPVHSLERSYIHLPAER